MHRKPSRLHLPSLWRGWRKYVTTFLGLAVAAGLGLAAAQWATYPTGDGQAFGKGKPVTSGLALVGVTFGLGVGTLVPIGPSESGQLNFAVHNPTANPNVHLTKVAPAPGAVITAVNDPTCVAPAGSFTAGTWTGSTLISTGNDSSPLSLLFTTTDAFPVCLAGQVFALPVKIDATE